MRRSLFILLVLGLALAAFLAFSRRPAMPPEDTLSYELLQAGPWQVEIETSEHED